MKLAGGAPAAAAAAPAMASAAPAAANPAPAPSTYPPCRRGAGDDSCIQLYERGVRR
jgi:hypothetical protein